MFPWKWAGYIACRVVFGSAPTRVIVSVCLAATGIIVCICDGGSDEATDGCSSPEIAVFVAIIIVVIIATVIVIATVIIVAAVIVIATVIMAATVKTAAPTPAAVTMCQRGGSELQYAK